MERDTPHAPRGNPRTPRPATAPGEAIDRDLAAVYFSARHDATVGENPPVPPVAKGGISTGIASVPQDSSRTSGCEGYRGWTMAGENSANDLCGPRFSSTPGKTAGRIASMRSSPSWAAVAEFSSTLTLATFTLPASSAAKL